MAAKSSSFDGLTEYRLNIVNDCLRLPGKRMVLSMINKVYEKKIKNLSKMRESVIDNLLESHKQYLSYEVLHKANVYFEAVQKKREEGDGQIKYQYIKSGKGKLWKDFVDSLDDFGGMFEDGADANVFPEGFNDDDFVMSDGDDSEDFSGYFNDNELPDIYSPGTAVTSNTNPGSDQNLALLPNSSDVDRYGKNTPEGTGPRYIEDRLTTMGRDDMPMPDSPSKFRGRLCPSCATGLCDTHIQLRF